MGIGDDVALRLASSPVEGAGPLISPPLYPLETYTPKTAVLLLFTAVLQISLAHKAKQLRKLFNRCVLPLTSKVNVCVVSATGTFEVMFFINPRSKVLLIAFEL